MIGRSDAPAPRTISAPPAGPTLDGVRLDERWDGGYADDDPSDPSWGSDQVDGAWLRSANPNSVDGELQNIAAFGAGLARLTGPRGTAARAVVWLILIGFAITIAYGVVGVIQTW